jgi:uncharacterized protein (TIGR02328 family)
MLYNYHILVMGEMSRRGYKPNIVWGNFIYRGKRLGFVPGCQKFIGQTLENYPEHNEGYLCECLNNLAGKGIELNIEEKHVLPGKK